MFILGQNPNARNSPFAGPEQTYMEVLKLFNTFDTGTKDNFQDMLYKLQFPFVYNDTKSLAENRRNFKDFFSCLTNIRCAVVEGLHRCEAACRTLQGYQLGAPISFHCDSEVDVPPSSTLFKPISTHVHYCQSDGMVISKDVLKHFRDISTKIADNKDLYVQQTWHNFFTNVLEDIFKNAELKKCLYKTQRDFYLEETIYHNMSKPEETQSCQIKLALHQILTKAIFTYKPCSELLDLCKKQKPGADAWRANTTYGKWLSLSVEPYQHVSDCTLKLFIIYFYLIQSLLLQVLKPTYRPNFGDFNTNLKRKNLWNSVEVHAIYALFYSMCMSLEGIVQLKKYFSAQDQDVFEPLFIAQYLFVPANTIIKNSLSPWMMEKLGIPLVKKLPDEEQARKNKAVVFLKYSVLVELMHMEGMMVTTLGLMKNYAASEMAITVTKQLLTELKTSLQSTVLLLFGC